MLRVRCLSMSMLLTLTAMMACKSDSTPSTPQTPKESATVNEVAPEQVKTTKKKEKPQPGLATRTKTLALGDGPQMVLFDLLDNRPLAHRTSELKDGQRFALDARADDFVKYINGNYPRDWNLGAEKDGEKGAWVKGSKANLWFPAPQGAKQLTLRIHSPAKGANSLKVKLNGKDLPQQKLQPGWQTIAIEGDFAPENTAVLKFTNMGRYKKSLSGGMLSWAYVEPLRADPAKTTEPSPSTAMGQGALTLGAGTGLSWHIWAVPKSILSLTYETNTPGCAPMLQASVSTKDGGVIQVASQKLEGKGDTSKAVAIDFGTLAKEGRNVVRTSLVASKECQGNWDTAKDKKPFLTLTKARLVKAQDTPKRPEVKPPKYIVFWMIDTLRADYLPFYNSKTNVEAPELGRIAKDGAIFELAYVQGNESKVSHASLFSGMYPSRHKVGAKGTLKPWHEIMPEAIKKAGYRTGAHISNGYISKPWGYQQGWNHFINNLRDGWRIDGASMAKHGIDWATKNKEKPFFLYVGTIDPHVTYRRHKELIGKYDEDATYNGRYKKYCSGEDLGKIKGGKLKPNERDQERIINLYKNEITFNDQAFGTLRKSFEEMGIWDETMVVVTADHGDEFWEHGGVGHGHSVHQELVHVPLIMYYKPLIKANTRVNAGVDVLDIYPTLVDILGQERPKHLQGRSAVPLLLGQRGGYPEPAIATRYLGHYGMQMEQYKLYLRSGDYHFFDRSSDPNEMKNVKANYPLESRWLLDSLGWFRSHRKQWDKQSWGVANNLSSTFMNEYTKPMPNLQK